MAKRKYELRRTRDVRPNGQKGLVKVKKEPTEKRCFMYAPGGEGKQFGTLKELFNDILKGGRG